MNLILEILVPSFGTIITNTRLKRKLKSQLIMPSGPKKRRAAKKKTNVNTRKGIDLHHEENDHILSALVKEDEDLVLIDIALSEPVVALSSKGGVVVDKVVSEDAIESSSKDYVGMKSINDVVDSSVKEDNSKEPTTEEVFVSNSNNEIDPHFCSKDALELGSKENEGNKFMEDVVNSSLGEDKGKESSQEVLDTTGSSRPMLVRALLSPSFLYTSCCCDTQLSKAYKPKASMLEGCCQWNENRDLDNYQGLDDVPFGAWHENMRRGRQAPLIFRATPPEEQGMTR